MLQLWELESLFSSDLSGFGKTRTGAGLCEGEGGGEANEIQITLTPVSQPTNPTLTMRSFQSAGKGGGERRVLLKIGVGRRRRRFHSQQTNFEPEILIRRPNPLCHPPPVKTKGWKRVVPRFFFSIPNTFVFPNEF